MFVFLHHQQLYFCEVCVHVHMCVLEGILFGPCPWDATFKLPQF